MSPSKENRGCFRDDVLSGANDLQWHLLDANGRAWKKKRPHLPSLSISRSMPLIPQHASTSATFWGGNRVEGWPEAVQDMDAETPEAHQDQNVEITPIGRHLARTRQLLFRGFYLQKPWLEVGRCWSPTLGMMMWIWSHCIDYFAIILDLGTFNLVVEPWIYIWVVSLNLEVKL